LTWKSCTTPLGHPDKTQWPPATFIAPARKGSSSEARVGHNYEPTLQMNKHISAFMITLWSQKWSGCGWTAQVIWPIYACHCLLNFW
jgi:hypothetical protein